LKQPTSMKRCAMQRSSRRTKRSDEPRTRRRPRGRDRSGACA
jgi:hypothetical protein